MIPRHTLSNDVAYSGSNSVACQESNRVIKSIAMATTGRRQLTEEEQADVDRLKALIAERKAKDGLTQEALAAKCEWSGQSAVQGFLSGRTPINLDAALRFSKALDVTLEDISPRLAAKAIELFGATKAAKETPTTVDGLLTLLRDDIDNADNDVRLAIADLVKAYNDDPTEGARIARSIRALLGQL